MTQFILFVGTYTLPASWVAGTCGEGIYTFMLDTETSELTPINEVTVLTNPSFLAIAHNGRTLYAVSEVEEAQHGRISAFTINQATGELTFLNDQPTLGSNTTHVMVDSTEKYVLLANYGGSESVAMLSIQADGRLSPVSSSVAHTEKTHRGSS